MTPSSLSPMWSAIAPALGNHLWQSTLFAVAAGFLTLVLRKNQARARYWLWLVASVKFLIPFSLLVGMGSRLAWSHASAGTNAGLYFAMNEVSQPFTQPTMSMISPAGPSAVSLNLLHLLPALFIAAWFGGFLMVLSFWYTRWRRIAAATREAAPLRDGREVEALRRLEQVGGLPRRIDMLLSRTSLEPGIFGIARPVLIWPEGISEHLEDAHLEAILAHELWHVRRRDNLAAAMHMVVEAIFWFHPLVWWLGARMVEERERACDEEVLELGSERQIYAESILKVCEFCLGSPLACVSGVTGADLKKRMVYIMTERMVRKLDLSRKLLLSAAGFVAIALPIAFGLVTATQIRAEAQEESASVVAPAYKFVTIQSHRPSNSTNESVGMFFSPNGFTATGVTLREIIKEAYGVQDDQITGASEWIDSKKYDIGVTLEDSPAADAPKAGGEIGIQQMRLMLQAVLADRFKLTLHRETRELSVYELVVADGGPKLQEAKPGDAYPIRTKGPEGQPPEKSLMMMAPGELTNQGASLAVLAQQLSMRLGRPVVDKTGLTGRYDFSLRWTPGEGEAPMMKGSDDKPSADASGPTLFTALQEQLGLKLEPQKAPLDIFVIDHLESPAGS